MAHLIKIHFNRYVVLTYSVNLFTTLHPVWPWVQIPVAHNSETKKNKFGVNFVAPGLWLKADCGYRHLFKKV